MRQKFCLIMIILEYTSKYHLLGKTTAQANDIPSIISTNLMIGYFYCIFTNHYQGLGTDMLVYLGVQTETS